MFQAVFNIISRGCKALHQAPNQFQLQDPFVRQAPRKQRLSTRKLGMMVYSAGAQICNPKAPLARAATRMKNFFRNSLLSKTPYRPSPGRGHTFFHILFSLLRGVLLCKARPVGSLNWPTLGRFFRFLMGLVLLGCQSYTWVRSAFWLELTLRYISKLYNSFGL